MRAAFCVAVVSVVDKRISGASGGSYGSSYFREAFFGGRIDEYLDEGIAVGRMARNHGANLVAGVTVGADRGADHRAVLRVGFVASEIVRHNVFVSRSSLEKVNPLDGWVRTTSRPTWSLGVHAPSASRSGLPPRCSCHCWAGR
jgi:hypothetical protein